MYNSLEEYRKEENQLRSKIVMRDYFGVYLPPFNKEHQHSLDNGWQRFQKSVQHIFPNMEQFIEREKAKRARLN